MWSSKLIVVVVVATVAFGTAVAGSVVAVQTPSDEEALQAVRGPADKGVEAQVSRLLAKMTLEEKLEQIQLLPDFLVTEEEVAAGLGSVLSVTDPARIRELQEIAVTQSRLKIPLLFAFDTIHGFRTVFPIPLGVGASFDPEVAFDDALFGARESAVVGLKQTYAPMVDVSHEPRWGRIAEGAGEDPYLNAVLAAARVKGTQGRDYSARDKLVASPKHFAAYGQPEAGRDYKHDRHVGAPAPQHVSAALQGRNRRRRGHGYVLVQRAQRRSGLRQRLPHERHPQGRVGLRRLRGGRLDRRRRAPRLPAEEPRLRRVRPRRRRGRARGCGARAECRRRLGDDEHAHPRPRRAAAQGAADQHEADRRRGPQDPPHQVPGRALREPVLAVPAGRGRGPDAEAGCRGGGAERREPLDGAAPERGRRRRRIPPWTPP